MLPKMGYRQASLAIFTVAVVIFFSAKNTQALTTDGSGTTDSMATTGPGVTQSSTMDSVVTTTGSESTQASTTDSVLTTTGPESTQASTTDSSVTTTGPESTQASTTDSVVTTTGPESTQASTTDSVVTTTGPESTQASTTDSVLTTTGPESTQASTTDSVVTTTGPESTQASTTDSVVTTTGPESTQASTTDSVVTTTGPESTQFPTTNASMTTTGPKSTQSPTTNSSATSTGPSFTQSSTMDSVTITGPESTQSSTIYTSVTGADTTASQEATLPVSSQSLQTTLLTQARSMVSTSRTTADQIWTSHVAERTTNGPTTIQFTTRVDTTSEKSKTDFSTVSQRASTSEKTSGTMSTIKSPAPLSSKVATTTTTSSHTTRITSQSTECPELDDDDCSQVQTSCQMRYLLECSISGQNELTPCELQRLSMALTKEQMESFEKEFPVCCYKATLQRSLDYVRTNARRAIDTGVFKISGQLLIYDNATVNLATILDVFVLSLNQSNSLTAYELAYVPETVSITEEDVDKPKTADLANGRKMIAIVVSCTVVGLVVVFVVALCCVRIIAGGCKDGRRPVVYRNPMVHSQDERHLLMKEWSFSSATPEGQRRWGADTLGGENGRADNGTPMEQVPKWSYLYGHTPKDLANNGVATQQTQSLPRPSGHQPERTGRRTGKPLGRSRDQELRPIRQAGQLMAPRISARPPQRESHRGLYDENRPTGYSGFTL